MQKDNYMYKKIDTMTLMLWIFIFFNIILFIYLLNINKLIEKHNSYHNAINKLELIDKTFDNFLVGQTTFKNYDNINKYVLEFEKNLEVLGKSCKNVEDTLKYQVLYDDIVKSYDVKLNKIEHYKSLNAQMLHSMHYLFELNLTILKSNDVDQNTKNILNETFLYLTKYFIDVVSNKKKIIHNLSFLKQSLEKNYVLEMDMFIMHMEINLSRMISLNKLKQYNEGENLFKVVDKLREYIHKNYEQNIFIEKIVVLLLFSVASIILYILIMINRKSLKMQDELLGFKTAIENSYNSIVMTDSKSNIIYINDVAQKETGYSKEELIGQNPRILKSGRNSKGFYENMHASLKDGKKWEGEFINKRKDGTFYYEKASIMPVFQNGKVVNYLAIKLNITDYIEAKREVEYMAFHDKLTSLPNRANIENYLQNRLIVAKREETKIALLFIDLDRFKNINDTLGHDIGDELLIEASSRIRDALRDSDMLSRFGGDEFVVVIENFDDEYSVAHVCEKILELFQKPIQTQNHQLNITLSIGVSMFPDDAKDSTTLFKYADVAMYKAKDDGKNNYKFYKKELSIAAHNRLDMEQALKVAMVQEEFYLMYQPQYQISDNAILGLEALVRWNSRTLGNVPPDKFIPVCEDIGYILELGLYIFRQACTDFLSFQKECSSLKTISINISAVQLYQDSFADEIIGITQEVGLETKSIILEITESHIMKNIHSSMLILNYLREKGFGVSIDDFGTGHSSLTYLKQFPVNELKIDKLFIENLPNDKADIAITKSILALSQSMGYSNVAEGIENETQEAFLRKNDCLLGQGYYFCKPKTKNDLINFLLTRNG